MIDTDTPDAGQLLDDEFFTVYGLARYLGVSPHTIYEWNAVGSGPAYYRIGRYVRYRKSDVEVWLEDRRQPAAS